MRLTKVFKSGNSQAVRLPKDLQFHSDEVEIFRRGNDIVLREIPKNLKRALEALGDFSDDFMSEPRKDDKPQKRNF